ncbi:HNH endonuclease family protein [Tessaracoccus sp.]
MRTTGTGWSRSTTWGIGALAAVTITGGASAGPWGGLGFAAIFTMATGVYQIVRGSSWVRPLIPSGRVSGAVLLLIGFAALFFAAGASSNSDPGATIPVTPSPSATTRVPVSTRATPSASSTSAPSPFAPPATSEAPDPQLAVSVLDALEIKGRAPRTGYDRALFGQRWADVDRNGCDTRNDILGRDLTVTTTKPNTRDCVILTGTLVDPYTGTTISFLRGQDTSSEVQIDHVVALSDAWQKGAQQLDEATRTLMANDPLNLLAVQGTANMQKGDGDAATWLPSNKAYRCAYVARQVAVKTRYGLWVTQAEHDAISRVLSQCPGQGLPDGGQELIAPPPP